MGQTCSSCCWNDRRASDVLEGEDTRALQEKLLDVSDYNDLDGNNGTTLTGDSRRNPYTHSDSRMKDSWPRPAATPTSGYDGYGDDDDDGGSVSRSGYDNGSDTDEQDDSERSSSGAGRSPMGNNAWNLNEAAGGSTFAIASDPMGQEDDVADDDDGVNWDSQAGIGPALRHDRALSAAQSARSTTSDSYASIRELPTYESLLFADDSSAKNTGSQDNDGDEDDEDDDDQGDCSSMFSSGQPSTSSSFFDSSSVLGGGSGHRKRSY